MKLKHTVATGGNWVPNNTGVEAQFDVQNPDGTWGLQTVVVAEVPNELDRVMIARARDMDAALRAIIGLIGNVEHVGVGANDARRYGDMLNGIRQIAQEAFSA